MNSKSLSMDSKKSEEHQENVCVVCFKGVETYSIGQCNHPVCFECSTRMRVLCRQNECPICRQKMPTVVFTKKIKPFEELKNSGLLNCSKFKIIFSNSAIKVAFYKLLEHKCPKCHDKLFSSFVHLKDHVKRSHQLSYCDLCVNNLKIFTFERRVYTRPELSIHNRHGDADDKSHKGHPLCEFCDVRYMDNDELYRHLRKDHLYCHFCDADGYHQYYSSYEFLRDHFKVNHFLCEEGDCIEEKFTSVFRTEIDLKAHRARAHGQTIGKMGLKQARTLELEFSLTPRPRHQNRGYRNLREEEVVLGEDSVDMDLQNQQLQMAGINTDCTQEFPSLAASVGGGARSGSAPGSKPQVSSSVRPPNNPRPPVTKTYDDIFPALASSSSAPASAPAAPSKQPSSKPPALSIQVHSGGWATRREAFPALAGIQKSSGTSGAQWTATTSGTAQLATTVTTRVGLPTFSLDTAQFPTLSSDGPTKLVVPPSRRTKSKHKQLNPPPPQPESKQKLPDTSKKKSKEHLNSKIEEIFNKENNNLEETNNNTNSKMNNNNNLSQTRSERTNGGGCLAGSAGGPPPGFEEMAVLRTSRRPPPGLPPPGFSKQNNHSYRQPAAFRKRNQELMSRLASAIGDADSFEQFRQISRSFRRGLLPAANYIEHCSHIMGSPSFNTLFPELLSLLPDIPKQQELLKELGAQERACLTSCAECQQVLMADDVAEHSSAHASMPSASTLA